MVSLLCCFRLYGLHKMDESVWKDELLTRKKKIKEARIPIFSSMSTPIV